MSKQRRVEKLERSARFASWISEMNDALRVKLLEKQREALKLPTRFDIENNTPYLLDIEITDDGVITISEAEPERMKEATIGTNRAEPKTRACDCE